MENIFSKLSDKDKHKDKDNYLSSMEWEQILDELSKKGVDDSGFDVLQRTIEKEIDIQYIRKGQIESRVGFLAAFWGVIMSVYLNVISKSPYIHIFHGCKSFNKCELIILLSIVITILFGLFKAGMVGLSMRIRRMGGYQVWRRGRNYKAASENKELFFLTLVESQVRVFERNEIEINKMAIQYR